MNEEERRKLLLNNLELLDANSYQHPCTGLKAYLHSIKSNVTSRVFPGATARSNFTYTSQPDDIPSTADLTQRFHCNNSRLSAFCLHDV
jgi:hypothetical protein